MKAVDNPYEPSAGCPPAALTGRDQQREIWEIALRRAEKKKSAQSVALYGLRGVGKTVLLVQFEKEAKKRDWITMRIEATTGKPLRELLDRELKTALTDAIRPNMGKKFLKALKTATSFFRVSLTSEGSWQFDVDLEQTDGGGANTGVLEADLGKIVTDLSEGAREQGVGIAILIDEAQDLTQKELSILAALAHTVSQQGLACVFAFAGLPSLLKRLSEAKSYSERLFNFQLISNLNEEDAKEALRKPAQEENVEWELEALNHVVKESGGYPYFLQQFGSSTWEYSAGPKISLKDAEIGTATGWASLDSGFFRVRWDRATPSEKNYLKAMADDGGSNSSVRDIASRLSREAPGGLSLTRSNLIDKGLIYAPEHGMVAYTVPGMADFITRQPAE